MTPQNVRDSPSAEGFTASVHKELRRSDRSTDGQPSAECRSRCFPKRQCALAAALANAREYSPTGARLRRDASQSVRRLEAQHKPQDGAWLDLSRPPA